MSESNNLGIQITATSAATATIKQLENTVRALEGTLKALGGTAQDVGGKITNSLQNEINAINKEIAARSQQVESIKKVTAAIKEQGEEAKLTFSTLQENINRNLGLNVEREIYSAVDSSKILAKSLSAAAEADARFRDSELQTAKATEVATRAMQQQASVVRSMSGAQHFSYYTAKQGVGQTAISAQQSVSAFEQNGLTAKERQINSLKPASGETTQQTIERLTGVNRAVSESAKYWRELELAEIATGKAGVDSLGKPIPKVKPESGRSGGAVSNFLQKEMRHIVGLFDSLARGSRGSAMSAIGAAARDAGLGVGALATSMTALVGVMAGAAILHHAEEMGKWATQARAAATATGMSLQQYTSLQGALRGLGVSENEADTSLRKLAESMSKAVAEPTSLAAQAFRNLGISQEQLIKTNGNTYAGLQLLAQAQANTADGANKTANMNELLGRGFERLLPLIQNGAQGLDAMTAEQIKLGNALDEQGAQKLQAAGGAVDHLGAVLRGEGVSSMEAWSGAIIAVAHSLETLLRAVGAVVGSVGQLDTFLAKWTTVRYNFTGDKSKGPMLSFGPSAYERAQQDDKAAEGGETPAAGGAKAAVPALTPATSALEAMRQQAAQAALAAVQGAKTSQAAHTAASRAEIAVMEKTLASAQLTAREKTQLETEIANKKIALAEQGISTGAKAAKQEYADFAAAEKLKISEAGGSSAKILAIYDEWANAAKNKFKESAAVVTQIERDKVQEINKINLGLLEETRNNDLKQNQLNRYNIEIGQMRSPGYKFSTSDETPSQLRSKAANDIGEAQNIESSAQAQIAPFKTVAAAAQQGSDVQKKAQDDILAILTEARGQEVALYKQAGEAAEEAAKKAAAAFTSFFSSIGSAFQSFEDAALQAVIAPKQELIKQGLTTIKKNEGGMEVKQALSSMLMGGIKDASKGVTTALSNMLGSAISGTAGTSLSAALGQMVAKAVTNIAGQTAGNAVGSALGNAAGQTAGATATAAPITAAVTAGSASVAATMTGTGATIVGAITASATAIVGAITAGAATEDTLLVGLNAKPSVLGTTYSMGGIVPSAAGGMVVGSNGSVGGMGGQLAVVHAKEMILPSHLSRGIQSIIDSGGGVGGGRGVNQSANLNYSPTINAGGRGRGGTGMTRAELGQMLSTHGGSMLGEARNMVRNGFRGG
jgi:hypothetical protein